MYFWQKMKFFHVAYVGSSWIGIWYNSLRQPKRWVITCYPWDSHQIQAYCDIAQILFTLTKIRRISPTPLWLMGLESSDTRTKCRPETWWHVSEVISVLAHVVYVWSLKFSNLNFSLFSVFISLTYFQFSKKSGFLESQVQVSVGSKIGFWKIKDCKTRLS